MTAPVLSFQTAQKAEDEKLFQQTADSKHALEESWIVRD
jgi:hypothetical protein